MSIFMHTCLCLYLEQSAFAVVVVVVVVVIHRFTVLPQNARVLYPSSLAFYGPTADFSSTATD